MKCQILFSGKDKKNILKCRTSAENFNELSVKYSIYSSFKRHK